MNSFPTSLPPPPPLARSLSAASFSSEDDASMSSSTATIIGNTRRTRKRFTNAQLTMLENLFHQNSHPSRDDREAVAKAGGMEIKSVTIWFQNKRQTERKTAASNNPGGALGASPNVIPNITSIMHTFSLHHNGHHSTRTGSPPFSASGRSTASSTGGSTRPSLDRVASRSEIRASAAPCTPSRRQTDGAIWDMMPSSPLAPPISPPAREFIDFGNHNRTRRTLEWACAAARLADKDGYASGMSSGFGGSTAPVGEHHRGSISASSSASSRGSAHSGRGRTVHRQKSHVHLGKEHEPQQQPRQRHPRTHNKESSSPTDMDVATDEEDHEAITPSSTWGKDDRRWTSAGEEGSHSLMALSASAASAKSMHDITMGNSTGGGGGPGLPKGVDDDDMFKAALALCGLGRRS